ncbi:Uncharacterised protein [Vibrio cholerae]|nr:Uncharacterised protein [Vibrio cholerae]
MLIQPVLPPRTTRPTTTASKCLSVVAVMQMK